MELMRLRGAFASAHITYVTVRKSYRTDVPGDDFYTVRDASRWNMLEMMMQILKLVWILLRVRPNVAIATGAAPGYWAIRIGKLLGARSCWTDSIANVNELSMSGQMAGYYTDLLLTQWQELATQDGPRFHGSVISANLTTNKDESHGHSPTAGSC